MPNTFVQVSKAYNQLITTDEIIGAGNGSTTVFSYTASQAPNRLESAKIKYTVASVLYTVTSNSSGNFIGTHISSGTITKAGLVSLTFSTAPDASTNVILDEYVSIGVLQQILDFCVTNKFTQTLGTGNGVLTTFSTTITNTVIAKGQCRITFKREGDMTIYDVYDNGEGIFDHPLINTSSLNYNTGAISITFEDPITNGYAINILYTTGAEGRDWLLLLEQNAKDSAFLDARSGTLLKEVVLKNSGASYKEPIFIGFREYFNTPTNLYGIEINFYDDWGNAMEAFSPPRWNFSSSLHGMASYDGTTEHWTSHPIMPLNNDDMGIWIMCDKKKIICVTRVTGTVYTSLYAGFGARLSAPQDYPKPVIIIGNVVGNTAFSSTSASYTFLIDPTSANQCLIRDDNGAVFDNTSNFLVLVPRQIDNVDPGDLKLTKTSKLELYPVYAVRTSPDPDVTLMLVEDIFWAPFINLAAEDIVSEGGVDHLIVQNIFRTSYLDYMAVRKIP